MTGYEPNTKEETALQREAFKYYYSMGEERSYSKVAVKFAKSVSTIEKWGKSFKWQERVDEMLAERAKRAEQQAVVEHELDYVQRNTKIVTRAILEHAKAIQEGTIKLSMKSLIDLIDLESKLRTGLDRKVEVNHRHEIRGLSNEELKKKIDERIARMDRYRNLKSFDELEDPIIDAEVEDAETGNQ